MCPFQNWSGNTDMWIQGITLHVPSLMWLADLAFTVNNLFHTQAHIPYRANTTTGARIFGFITYYLADKRPLVILTMGHSSLIFLHGNIPGFAFLALNQRCVQDLCRQYNIA